MMERVPMRDGYGKALLELCRTHEEVIVMDADVAKSTRTEWVREQYPDKYLNVGISEQDLVGTAAGMSLAGLVPYISTYGVFLAGRAWGQIRNTVCYNHLNVKLGGAHAGISVGPDGATHQALEDVALMRCIPNMMVIVPCDWRETYKATMAVYDVHGPTYVRFGRNPAAIVTQEDTPFDLLKAAVFREGTDVSVFANGLMVHEALKAADILAGEGISAQVVNVHTVKPLDEKTLLACAAKTGAAVICEEHQRIGGLGGAICELLCQHCCVPVELVGIKDRFGESGWPDELLRAYGLSGDDIVVAVKKVLARKRK
ncbi:MAG: transketolase family protein [Megasphaera sp.]|nr:transketolase family protein [Megasphaera sp.]